MKINIRIIPFRKLLLVIFSNLLFVNVYSQKLPNLQSISLHSPMGIKIDGRSSEWGDQYQAFNKGTQVFYSIANDNDNIYLIVHADKSRIIEKILEGGISFNINTSGKKSDDKNVTILFPLLTMPTSWGILKNSGKTLTEETNIIASNDKYGVLRAKDSILNSQQNPSIDQANIALNKSLREIKVIGIDSIMDEIVIDDPKSIYYRGLPLHKHPFKLIPMNNKENIRAMINFDNNGGCTYELAVPLKHIKFSTNDLQKVYYSVTLNSRSEDERFGASVTYISNRTTRQMEIKDIDLNSDTSFSGEYTLVKK